MQALDRNCLRIEVESGDRPSHLTVFVEPRRDFRTLHARLGDAPLAAYQGTQPEFDTQRPGPHAAGLVRAGDLDALHDKRRRGQQARINWTSDVNFQSRQPAGVSFELAAVARPVHEKRPNQRGCQRQDDRDRQAQQGRLHAISTLLKCTGRFRIQRPFQKVFEYRVLCTKFTGFYQTPRRDSSFLLIDFAAAGRANHALG